MVHARPASLFFSFVCYLFFLIVCGCITLVYTDEVVCALLTFLCFFVLHFRRKYCEFLLIAEWRFANADDI